MDVQLVPPSVLVQAQKSIEIGGDGVREGVAELLIGIGQYAETEVGMVQYAYCRKMQPRTRVGMTPLLTQKGCKCCFLPSITFRELVERTARML
jgi:hypothetical protein